MSVTLTTMTTKVRRRLADKTTRRDGTSISNPFYPDADITAAVNDCVRERQPDIIAQDKTFYLRTPAADYIGITNAVAASGLIIANEQYELPTDFKDFVKLVRSDLPGYPVVKKVKHDEQEALKISGAWLFYGFYATYPENVTPTHETCAVVSGVTSNAKTNRLRILPAPASTSYTYRLWYQRQPTEVSSGTHEIDIPDEWQEVIALDAALYLVGTTNERVAGLLAQQRDLALANRAKEQGNRDAGPVIFREARI